MDLTVVDDTEKSRFEARTADGALAGWVEYTRTAESVTLDHTEVDGAYGGQGVGSTLVKQTLAIVLDEGVAVVNDCPFIERYMRRHEGEYDAVVRKAGP
ncbi:MAG: GNAT family N-acetyltransferase [Jiangellales bacterium]